MPNWTTNSLTITGSPEDLQKLHNLIIDKDGDFDFNSLIPMPAELKDTTAPNFEYIRKDGLTDEQVLEQYTYRFKTLEEVAAARTESDRLIELYGFDNWYDWCVTNWGTKWNANETQCTIEEDTMTLWFMTAWSQPVPIYSKLEELFPQLGYEIQTEWEGFDEGEIATYDPTTKEWTISTTTLVRLHPETDEPLFFKYEADEDADEEYYVDQHGNKWEEDDYISLDTDWVVL